MQDECNALVRRRRPLTSCRVCRLNDQQDQIRLQKILRRTCSFAVAAKSVLMIMADLPSKVATSSRSCCFVIASTQRWYMTALCFFWMVCSSIAHVQSMRRSTFAYFFPPFFVVPGSSVGSHRIKCAGACVHSKGHSYNLLSHPHSESQTAWRLY